MILAAGLGTRLYPLTQQLPKPLIEVNGHTMLETTVSYLKKYGIDELVINVHYMPDKIRSYLERKHNFGCSIEFSDESGQLMGTGGGIVHARHFLCGDEPFLVIGSDILTDLCLDDFIAYHQASGNLVSLAVMQRETSRSLFADHEGLLAGWRNNGTGEFKAVEGREPKQAFGFNCVHIIEPEIWDFLPSNGEFNIIDVYLQLAAQHRIGLYEHKNGHWMEFGRISSIEAAQTNPLVAELHRHIFVNY